jgi:predicted transcriptional regulator
MAKQEARKSGGGKLSRSETVTVRLDPKLRYMAELAARKQRRTLSSFIEWAIEDALAHVYVEEGSSYQISVADDAAKLWDVDEADRFVKLALRYPDLLTHEEQVIWKLIKECGLFWYGAYDGFKGAFQWTINDSNMRFESLREHWDTLKNIATGEIPKSEMPKWSRYKEEGDSKSRAKSGFEEFDDDIPF